MLGLANLEEALLMHCTQSVWRRSPMQAGAAGHQSNACDEEGSGLSTDPAGRLPDLFGQKGMVHVSSHMEPHRPAPCKARQLHMAQQA